MRLAYQRRGPGESWKSEVWVLLLSFQIASSPPPKLCLVLSGGDQASSTSFINIPNFRHASQKSITEKLPSGFLNRQLYFTEADNVLSFVSLTNTLTFQVQISAVSMVAAARAAATLESSARSFGSQVSH